MATKKASAKKATAKRAPGKKSASGKTAVKKSSVRKTATKKSPAKKSSAKKSSTRKYGSAAGKSIEREMKAMKQGKLKSGRSGRKVTNPKQAIAIGLSEARKAGAKVPKKKS